MFDLVMLLQESLTGFASTAIFVCASQAPLNAMHSKFALEFGEVFSRLTVKERAQKPESRAAILKRAQEMLASATAACARPLPAKAAPHSGMARTRTMREAQGKDAASTLAVLEELAR